MKKAPDFASALRDELLEYVKFMVDNGRAFRVETTILKEFDRFLQTQNTPEIGIDEVEQFVYGKEDLTGGQYEKRHRIIRGFLNYRAIKGTGKSVPPPPKTKRGGRRIPYLYTQSDLARMISLAGELAPANSLRPHTYQTVIGLIVCTGLRVSEALNLDVSDVDLTANVLYIRATKFRKSRYVPLHPTAASVLKKYAETKTRYFPGCENTAFFLNTRGKRVAYGTYYGPFLRLVREAGISTESRNSTTHDLRHTFAVNRMLAWYEEGLDFRDMLPVLSTYMGHAHFEDTVYYLNASAALMAKGAKSFRFGGGHNA